MKFLCVTERYLQHVLILIPNLCPVNYYKQVISWLFGQWMPKRMLYGCKYCVGDWGKDM